MVKIIRQFVCDEKNEIGRLRDWCCGVDFKPEGSRSLFSILHLKNSPQDHQKIIDCIEEILQLPLDKLKGHYNWHHKDWVSDKGIHRAEFSEIAAMIR